MQLQQYMVEAENAGRSSKRNSVPRRKRSRVDRRDASGRTDAGLVAVNAAMKAATDRSAWWDCRSLAAVVEAATGCVTASSTVGLMMKRAESEKAVIAREYRGRKQWRLA